MMPRPLPKLWALLVAVVLAAAALASCGDDEESGSGSTDTDAAFVAAMIPHHESAIEMAKMAREQAQHPQVRQLASDIISGQGNEIDILEQIHQRLVGEPAGEMNHGSMGLSEDEMGMSMDMDALEQADPFDREFIDQMIAHHQGAIRMARIQLAEGSDDEAKSLADAIITAQSLEIEQMNDWRTKWYGEPSPSGGVPEETEAASDAGSGMEGMEGMEH